MNRLTHGRVQRIHAEFRGDDAVELDILEVTLRLGEVARTRIEADTVLTRLAYKALYRAIEEYCRKTRPGSAIRPIACCWVTSTALRSRASPTQQHVS